MIPYQTQSRILYKYPSFAFPIHFILPYPSPFDLNKTTFFFVKEIKNRDVRKDFKKRPKRSPPPPLPQVGFKKNNLAHVRVQTELLHLFAPKSPTRFVFFVFLFPFLFLFLRQGSLCRCRTNVAIMYVTYLAKLEVSKIVNALTAQSLFDFQLFRSFLFRFFLFSFFLPFSREYLWETRFGTT